MTPTPAAQADAASRIQRHLRQCEELAEIGMKFVRAVAADALDAPAPTPQTTDGAPPAPPTAAARAAAAALFTKLSGAIRQTMLLEARIAADAQAETAAPKDARPEKKPLPWASAPNLNYAPQP